MKLKLSVNFSFGNLSRRLNKITKEYVEDFAKSSEVISKKTIDIVICKIIIGVATISKAL